MFHLLAAGYWLLAAGCWFLLLLLLKRQLPDWKTPWQ